MRKYSIHYPKHVLFISSFSRETGSPSAWGEKGSYFIRINRNVLYTLIQENTASLELPSQSKAFQRSGE